MFLFQTKPKEASAPMRVPPTMCLSVSVFELKDFLLILQSSAGWIK